MPHHMLKSAAPCPVLSLEPGKQICPASTRPVCPGSLAFLGQSLELIPGRSTLSSSTAFLSLNGLIYIVNAAQQPQLWALAEPSPV